MFLALGPRSSEAALTEMPWTTAPPTYRSILSLSRAASPSESALATSLRPRVSVLSPTAWKGRKLSCEVAVVRARETAHWTGTQGVKAGVPLARGLHSPAGTQHPRGCGRRGPARRRQPRGPSAHFELAAVAGIRSCQALVVGLGKLFRSPRASEAAGFRSPGCSAALRLATPREK